VQAGRYAAVLDPLTIAGGPDSEIIQTNFAPLSNGRGKLDLGSRKVLVTNTAGLPNSTNITDVILVAEGGENALGFSIAYNPSALKFLGSSRGAAAGGATINVNTNQASAGKLGVTLALSAGQSFAAGSNQLLHLSFQIIGSVSGTYSLTFNDQPVPREVADTNAIGQQTQYVDGSIMAAPLPTISIARSGTDVKLSWPGIASNFVLETSSAQFPLGGSWTNAPGTPQYTNGENLILIPVDATPRFFRLRKP
jgi:hypothetical protein